MLNFAIVGCGRIAKRHSELLGSNQIGGAKLVAVCDIILERAKAMGERFKVPYYTDMNRMMIGENVDVVSILTPSGFHSRHIVELAKFKKNIIVEKPLAINLEQADAAIKACEENGVRLFVVKQNRFNVPIIKLREAVKKNRFGKLVLGTIRVRWCRTQDYYDQDAWRGTWAYDGGVITNQASHHIDLLEWMMGEVESFFAKSIRALVDIETEDTVVATIKFKNGALGTLEATTATRPKDLEGSISILGEKATVEVGGFAVNEMKIWNFLNEEEGDDEVLNKYSVNPPNVYGFGHKAYYEHVVDCIINNKPQLVDGYEGRKSIELISAFYESIETGKEIFLKDFKPVKCKLGMLNLK
jgi:predicted dehydrogenase